MPTQPTSRSSRRPLAVALAIGLTVLCGLALHLAPAESPVASRAAEPSGPAPSEGQTASPRLESRGTVGGEPEGARAAAAVVLAPEFDPHERLEPGKTAKLKFRAVDGASGAPLRGAEISVSLFHMPGHEKIRLVVSELGDGSYEAEFTPDQPGRYEVAVASRGLPAATNVPMSLGVVGAVGADEPADDSDEVVLSNAHARIKTGGGRARR
ncbi:MAG TPA: filamin/ABP280 repeat domain-containing protein [Anaeromyxobacteraceae bacterium]